MIHTLETGLQTSAALEASVLSYQHSLLIHWLSQLSPLIDTNVRAVEMPIVTLWTAWCQSFWILVIFYILFWFPFQFLFRFPFAFHFHFLFYFQSPLTKSRRCVVEKTLTSSATRTLLVRTQRSVPSPSFMETTLRQWISSPTHLMRLTSGSRGWRVLCLGSTGRQAVSAS